MQLKLLSSVLLVSAALIPNVLATASPAPNALSAADPIAAAQPNANADLGEVVDKIDETFDDIGDKIDDTVEKIKDTVGDWVEEVKNWKFPEIDVIPDNVEQWFKDAKSWFKDFPQEAWEKIKEGVYPDEVSDWVNSLPEKMRAEARENLKEWANELDKNSAMSAVGGLSLGLMGAAGAVAVVLAF